MMPRIAQKLKRACLCEEFILLPTDAGFAINGVFVPADWRWDNSSLHPYRGDDPIDCPPHFRITSRAKDGRFHPLFRQLLKLTGARRGKRGKREFAIIPERHNLFRRLGIFYANGLREAIKLADYPRVFSWEADLKFNHLTEFLEEYGWAKEFTLEGVLDCLAP